MDARAELLDLIEKGDPFDHAASDLQPLRLQAAHEVFQDRREQVPILDRRAKEAGIDEIRTLSDLVPLLFAHTVYKSYPQALVDNNRWDRMLRWLDSLSAVKASKVDVEGVANVDEWIDRLREAGHMVLATSGTTGKSSFLNQTAGDIDERRRYFRHAKGWPYVRPNRDRPFFALGPSRGPTSLVEAFQLHADVFGRPGDIYFLTDEPIRLLEINQMAQLRRRMAEGSVSPQEVQKTEERAQARMEVMKNAVARLAAAILAHQHEPVYITGMYPQHVLVVDAAHALGGIDGGFHPESVVHIGGGVKNAVLPPDYKERVARFYGEVHDAPTYGMTEMAQALVRCEAKRYHAPPAQIMLLLDQSGERLLTADDGGPDGQVAGRFAFLDLLHEGRWGGLISGDRVTVDFSERCPCGRHGPTVLDTIGRFSQPNEDDYIGCAGTLDAYIRGVLAS